MDKQMPQHVWSERKGKINRNLTCKFNEMWYKHMWVTLCDQTAMRLNTANANRFYYRIVRMKRVYFSCCTWDGARLFQKKIQREEEKNRGRKKGSITFSHRVSGGSELLYAGVVLFGYTVRCVVVVFVAAYRISAPTNKPVKHKQFVSFTFVLQKKTLKTNLKFSSSVCKHHMNHDDNYYRHETLIWIVLNFADSIESQTFNVNYVEVCHMLPIYCGFSKHSHWVWSAETTNEFISKVLISRINTHYLFIQMCCVRG